MATPGSYWRRYFNVAEFEGTSDRQRRFDNSINTDGVAISLSMQRSKKAAIEEGQQISQQRPKEGDLIFAVDPGARLMFATVAYRYNTDVDTTLSRENFIQLKAVSNREWRHRTGELRRRKKLLAWTKRVERKSRSQLSPKRPSELERYVTHRLTFFDMKQNVYARRKIARMRLEKYMEVEKTAYQVAREMLTVANDEAPPAQPANDMPDANTTTDVPNEEGRQKPQKWLFLGSAKIASNSPVRGYVRTPQSLLRRILQSDGNCKLIITDEHLTTKLCSTCHDETTVSRSPHRFVVSNRLDDEISQTRATNHLCLSFSALSKLSHVLEPRCEWGPEYTVRRTVAAAERLPPGGLP